MLEFKFQVMIIKDCIKLKKIIDKATIYNFSLKYFHNFNTFFSINLFSFVKKNYTYYNSPLIGKILLVELTKY